MIQRLLALSLVTPVFYLKVASCAYESLLDIRDILKEPRE